MTQASRSCAYHDYGQMYSLMDDMCMHSLRGDVCMHSLRGDVCMYRQVASTRKDALLQMCSRGAVKQGVQAKRSKVTNMKHVCITRAYLE